MRELTPEELEEVAAAYEELLVPALFGEWAQQVAVNADIRPGRRVLDVACGTGVLARTAAKRVGPNGSVSGVDVNPAMLAVAKRISPEIDWQEGAAEALPYEDNSFDAVVSQFGLMLFSSPEAAIREMMRVLRRGGCLTVAVFDSLDNLPAYEAIANVYERIVDKSVGETLRVPFSMGDTDQIASCFAAAGIDAPAVTTIEGTARFPNVRNMVLSDVKGWFPFAQIHLDEPTIEAVIQEAEEVLRPFRTADGAVAFPVSAHVVRVTKAQ